MQVGQTHSPPFHVLQKHVEAVFKQENPSLVLFPNETTTWMEFWLQILSEHGMF